MIAQYPTYLCDVARIVYQTVSIDLRLRDYEKRIALGEKGRLSTAPDLLRLCGSCWRRATPATTPR